MLVTGGTGFVGANLVRELIGDGHRVRVLARKGGDRRALEGCSVDIAEGDLLDVDSVRAAVAGARRVYHVAADYRLWAPDPRALYRANVDGTRHVLEAAALAGVERIVYTSTVGAVGIPKDGTPGDERTPVSLADMVGPYKASKFLAERVADELAARGAPVVTVNPSAPIGPWDVKPTPTGQMVVDFLRGKMLGSLDTGLNVVHVGTWRAGTSWRASAGRVGERYILGNQNLSLLEIFTVARAAHRDPRAPLPRALRARLGGGGGDGGRGRADAPAAAGAAHRGADGEKAHVLQRGQGGGRARASPDPARDGARRCRRLVRPARLRAPPREGGVNAGQFVSRLTRKSRSNFFYAFLCLPRGQRDALYAVYAFCRIVDDAVDVGQDRDEQRRELARWREEIGRVYGGTPAHPAGERLQEAIRAFPIPRSVLDEIITGVEMDLDHPRYETFEDLYLYCYRVASAVGLACIEIFGYRDPRARDYAVHLGIALQLTNIMRDVQADARAGRVYLPQEDLRRFGVTAEDLAAGRYTPGFVELMAWEAARARDYYERGLGRAAPRGRGGALCRGDHGAHVLGAPARPRGPALPRLRPAGLAARVPKLAIALGCWMRARWGRRRPDARPRRA